MGRKVFISFLGTTKYTNCNYYPEGNIEKRINDVKYVQEALLQLYCTDFDKKDTAFFFLTRDAKKQNWVSDGQWNGETNKYDLENIGLHQRLQDMKAAGKYKGQLKAVDIPEGFSSEEIWSIFQLVFDCLKPKDAIILDITHAFRSLPMLGMVLINYAKTLKSATIKGIYYGAFEQLGFASAVGKMDIDDRNAPILNLLSFSELQDWTIAADSFQRSGDTSGIVELTGEKIAPILKTTKGASLPAKTLNGLSKNLELLTGMISTNRGKTIIVGKVVDDITINLSDIEQNPKIIPALRPVLNKIGEKLEVFNSQIPNWIAAVDWCIEHNLIQQGITQLQEGILTQLCEKAGNGLVFKLDFTNETHRSLPKQAMNIINKKMEDQSQKWYWPANQNVETVKKLLVNKWVIALEKPFNALSGLRNDINHGGYLSDKTPEKFKKELTNKFNQIKEILKNL